MGNRSLRRMAERMVKRAKISGEKGVTVSFGYSSLLASVVVGFLEDIPYLGLLLTFLTFGWHRIVLVTDAHAYVFKAKPFHRPGEELAKFPLGEATVKRRRGKLTFSDGEKVWHSPLFASRAKRVQKAIEGS